jgi:hypothetical protein
MTLKVNMHVEKIALSLEAIGINPYTQKPYANCNSCRAKKRAQDYIGREIIDDEGRLWVVKGYMDNVDHRATYPYTCHSIDDGEFTIWYTVEETVRECIERARVRVL